MPITSAGLTGAIITGLASATLIGQGMPKLAQGIANGLVPWIKSLSVVTADAGSAGVGTSFMVWAVPGPVLVANLLIAYPANGHIGVMAPLEATGLGIGLGLGFIQGAMVSQHAGVGTGTGIARVTGGPAFPFLMQGFAGADIKGAGAVQKASAISQALAITLAAFTLPVPIVGSASPAGASGVGLGRIL